MLMGLVSGLTKGQNSEIALRLPRVLKIEHMDPKSELSPIELYFPSISIS